MHNVYFVSVGKVVLQGFYGLLHSLSAPMLN